MMKLFIFHQLMILHHLKRNHYLSPINVSNCYTLILLTNTNIHLYFLGPNKKPRLDRQKSSSPTLEPKVKASKKPSDSSSKFHILL